MNLYVKIYKENNTKNDGQQNQHMGANFLWFK